MVRAPDRSRSVRLGAIALTVIGVALPLIAVWLRLTLPATASSQVDTGFALILIPVLTMAAVGLVLAMRQPANPVGWLVSASLIAFDLLMLGTAYTDRYSSAHDMPGWLINPMQVLSTLGWSAGFPLLLIILPLVFPDGHLVSHRWRWAVRAALATIAMTVVATMASGAASASGPPSDSFSFAMGMLAGPVSGLFMLALIVSAVVSLVIRYRRAGSERRHQLKWFVAAMALAGVAVIPEFAGNNDWYGGLGLMIGLMVVPLSIGVAVLKYRLYDIDVVIGRALVYGTLAAFITAVYVGIVVGVGTLIGSGGRPNIALSIVATAVVAVGFQPVRERLQRVANRLVYGRRATPYEVLSEFSERVAGSYAADEVLPRMARVLAEGTGADHAEVWLRGGAILRRAATWPEEVGATESAHLIDGSLPEIRGTDRLVEVRHQGDLLGALAVTKRPGESLTPVEEKLLEDLASQAGLVLKNVGLTDELLQRLEELRASRQRLVAAQDEERRRLERNLHDGAQQNLVALKVKLGLAETFADKNPAKARQLLGEIKSDADEALETLRDLARGIYPPLLADKGLAAALESQARKATIPVAVEADGIGRFPQDVEAAVYFCCLEALQNIQKYASAASATVRFAEIDGILTVAVLDDGDGFNPAAAKKGSGLQNMEDRLDALGGTVEIESTPGSGATVTVRLPITEAVPA